MSFSKKDLERQLVLLSEIENQSDRGAAIIGAAWLDEELSVVIKSKGIKDEKTWGIFCGDTGVLGTFSSKIELSYLLGFITKIQRQDLQKIRKIRNDFAHKLVSDEISMLKFSTPKISDRCMSLECVKFEKIATAREAFCRSCVILYADIYLSTYFE